MKIELVNNSNFKCDEAAILSVAKYSLKKMGVHPDSELGIRFVNEDEMSELHIKWMDLPGPTDVLSFPMDEIKPNSSSNGPGVIGDIVLCPAFAEKNGKQSLAEELELLTVHGVLHLLGFDHEEISDERAMFAIQDEILKRVEIVGMSFSALILVMFLLLFAGLLAGSESALTSLSRLLIEEIVEVNPRYKKRFDKFVENPARYLNVLLLVRKSCELTATALVATAFVDGASNYGLALSQAILLMVAISYVIVGVGPRTLGKQHAPRWSKPSITIAYFLSQVLGPLTNLLIRIGNAITPGKGFKSGPFSTEAEFRDLVDQASESGFVEESEREMIHSVFDLGETLVRELMIPRTEMVWIESGKNLRQALSLALRSGFTRIPVIADNLDNVVGIAYVKDLAKRVHEKRDAEQNENVEQHLRKATFIPETKTAAELLKQMQRDQIHMAVVVDEYGGTAGLITIEDILEEIVGEIADEYDDDETEEIEWLSEAKARVSARLHVEDFAEKFETEFTEDEIEDVDSIGGLLAKQLGRVPIPGSTITVPGWKLTAERPAGRRHRIATVLVEKIAEASQISDQL